MASHVPPSAPRWRAAPGCPQHLRYTLEKAVNAHPPEWLREPQDGEIFNSIEECERRLVVFSLSQGFDVIKKNTSKKPTPSANFVCVHHGVETKN